MAPSSLAQMPYASVGFREVALEIANVLPPIHERGADGLVRNPHAAPRHRFPW